MSGKKPTQSEISHFKQRDIWNAEHKNPQALTQLDLNEPSGGVVKFYDFLTNIFPNKDFVGLEMGCGKGRNTIWLAKQQKIKKMFAFDFSPFAIALAKERISKNIFKSKIDFKVSDAVLRWDYPSNSFDFTIDCFVSCDIESEKGRLFAIREMKRVLKKGGYLMVYSLTSDDEFHKKMIVKFPAKERGSFYYPTGKFEKVFEEDELKKMYKDFGIMKWDRVIKTTQYFGKNYRCSHFWLILQKI